jgi:hypothetical protein
MTNLTERDDLISQISDFTKDLWGCRPCLEWTRTATIEELRTEADRVAADLEREIERLEQETRRDIEAWERQDEATEPEPETFPASGEGWAFTPAAG